jgi:hypothetical protein
MENQTATESGTVPAVVSSDLLGGLRAHAQKLAGQLAECAGYLASVRTDRQILHHEELFALQTVEWAEGAAEIAEKANAALKEHDSLDAMLAECGAHMEAAREASPDTVFATPDFLRAPREGFRWQYRRSSDFSRPDCLADWHEVPSSPNTKVTHDPLGGRCV